MTGSHLPTFYVLTALKKRPNQKNLIAKFWTLSPTEQNPELRDSGLFNLQKSCIGEELFAERARLGEVNHDECHF